MAGGGRERGELARGKTHWEPPERRGGDAPRTKELPPTEATQKKKKTRPHPSLPPFPPSSLRLVEALDAYDTRGGGAPGDGDGGDFDFGGAGDGYGAGLDSLDGGGNGYTGHLDAGDEYDDYDDYGDGGDFLMTGGAKGGKGGKRYRMVSDDEEEEGVEYVPAPYTADGTVVE